MRIVSVNTSVAKGTPKEPCSHIVLNNNGIEGDAHAGDWHRQVSLLGIESYQKELIEEEEVPFGIYAENITLEGAPSKRVPELRYCTPGDRLHSSGVLLEITQIGKKCHGGGCSVMQKTGSCVMPSEGIFAKVLRGGVLKKGDELFYEPVIRKIGIITTSTRASQGVYPDLSGAALKEMIEKFCEKEHWTYEIDYTLIPDNATLIEDVLNSYINKNYDMVFTTGGTGIGVHDLTVKSVKPLLQREIPGIMDYIRIKYGSENPNALISGSVAGITGNTLIFTLPGSLRAVNEYFTEISRCLKHLILMKMGIDTHGN